MSRRYNICRHLQLIADICSTTADICNCLQYTLCSPKNVTTLSCRNSGIRELILAIFGTNVTCKRNFLIVYQLCKYSLAVATLDRKFFKTKCDFRTAVCGLGLWRTS